MRSIIAQNIDQVLRESHPEFEVLLKILVAIVYYDTSILASQLEIERGVEKLNKTGAGWKGNDIINVLLKVGSLVKDIASTLKYVMISGNCKIH